MDRFYKIIEAKDLIVCANELLTFCEEIKQLDYSKRKTYLLELYNLIVQRVHSEEEYSLYDDIFGFFQIVKKRSAVASYLKYFIPPFSTPAKTIEDLQRFSLGILNDYSKPIGKVITRKEIFEIEKYVNNEFNLMKTVFFDYSPDVLIIPNTKKDADSEVVVWMNNQVTFILSHMKTQNSDEANPIAVFFHELGHAVHSSLLRKNNDINNIISNKLKASKLPDFESFSTNQQQELIADIFSMGMMYNSVYDKWDLFSPITNETKERFREIFCEVLEYFE